jgi:hypothetical protein
MFPFAELSRQKGGEPDMDKREIIYKALKVIESHIEPKAGLIGVESEAFNDAMEQVEEDRLATNITIAKGGQTHKILMVYANGSRLTEQGKNFMKHFENKL